MPPVSELSDTGIAGIGCCATTTPPCKRPNTRRVQKPRCGCKPACPSTGRRATRANRMRSFRAQQIASCFSERILNATKTNLQHQQQSPAWNYQDGAAQLTDTCQPPLPHPPHPPPPALATDVCGSVFRGLAAARRLPISEDSSPTGETRHPHAADKIVQIMRSN